MVIDLAMMESDLAAIEGDIVQTFSWSGASYACCASEVTRGSKLEMEGLYDDCDLQIVVRLSLLTNGRPGPNNIITHNGRKFRVERASDSPDGISLTLWCMAVTA